MKKLVNRREFLKLSALTAVGATAAACGAQATPDQGACADRGPGGQGGTPPRRPLSRPRPRRRQQAPAACPRRDQGP